MKKILLLASIVSGPAIVAGVAVKKVNPVLRVYARVKRLKRTTHLASC
ncbi:MAG: hypothetical protein HY974_03755 [Candidatus Kerfeldbacteria bacterium]|nr:hypothetical protein [Candidatus Kerfeldbacteria bacterium]